MQIPSLYEKYGLFDAKVPRFTSYPPANHFVADAGSVNQEKWLDRVPENEPVSIYVHIPFCRRLCWFCACRTQGTKTLSPVADYVESLCREFDIVAPRLSARKMVRLHLGGGTPTLLTPELMDRLLSKVWQVFSPTPDFEFSVEIDPTEASPETLHCLSRWGMNRASIGIQDFSPRVQEAIGRPQSFEVTQRTIETIRDLGVGSLNLDLLYGLPFQTTDSLLETLEQIEALSADRLALYGYAHVPHVSKRQVMIASDALPNAYERFEMAEKATKYLTEIGFIRIGIDHFAKPNDGLAKALRDQRLHRNFQGYTDDPAQTLLGFGASAISRFVDGFSQNAVATAAYRGAVDSGGLAGARGFCLSADDKVTAGFIEDLMCYFKSPLQPHSEGSSRAGIAHELRSRFPEIIHLKDGELSLLEEARHLVRIVAATVQPIAVERHAHSSAI